MFAFYDVQDTVQSFLVVSAGASSLDLFAGRDQTTQKLGGLQG